MDTYDTGMYYYYYLVAIYPVDAIAGKKLDNES